MKAFLCLLLLLFSVVNVVLFFFLGIFNKISRLSSPYALCSLPVKVQLNKLILAKQNNLLTFLVKSV